MGNKVQKLTQALTMIALISASLWLVVSAEAGAWWDEFNDEKLEGWTLEGRESTWTVENGLLRAKIRTQFDVRYELFQLTALDGPYENFTITVKDIGSKGANFGIGLAKVFPDAPGEKLFFYVFLTNLIQARRFNGRDPGSIPFLIRIPRHPGTIWETTELKQMELTFNAGRFQMFANGELRADFEDLDFDPIDIIGFVLVGFKVSGIGEAWVDSFTISGPSLAVEPRGKLATTWGKLKLKQ